MHWAISDSQKTTYPSEEATGEWPSCKAEAVEKLHNDEAKMFAAVKEMKLQKAAYGIMVNNIAGERIMNPNEQVSKVSRCPEGQFKSLNAQDLQDLGTLILGPLCSPITQRRYSEH